MIIAKHVGFEIELQVVWGEMKGVDHRAKSYCNKTMSSSGACEGTCSIKRQLKQTREGEKNAEMKQREGKESDSGVFGVTAWLGASASRVLYSVQVCFQRNTIKVVLGSY